MMEILEELEEKKEKKRVTFLLGLIVILLAIIVISIILLTRSNQPIEQAKKEAIAIARQHTNLSEVDHFYQFSRKKVYFSLTGKEKDGKEIAVIIPKKSGKITVLNQKDGLTEEAVRQLVQQQSPEESIKKASLGIYKGKPAWEVVTTSKNKTENYYVVSFKEGKYLSTIHNI
ncbi:cell wall elongation regulator TseB-like domain-containing protein [Melissococcus plutonius]|uniref:Cell wall elongation regulator TseB-like domain-containing protein n=1 Tax=Melissococcus plutonius TaxID=33970 RepID=A0A2Z5Y251_9ENTE|nr:DUF5590 domain-containing protein [Melissococcus plutonius]KMT31105.1 hypothetical protein MEPL6_4c00080 [Melissococcus plutonius]KMT33803.1 hypothetical protein MEPL8_6c00080 [Melissococcus plutonius]KMT39754.1 hypothetical protein MEPL12_4c00080 [Melissococcus plutonius]MCV2505096.1 DUF5590 domain-containing protein [Melissococcus plutonius]BBC60863.1 hypothetical protein DAT561_0746 [Melissococcus plutonius]